MSQYQNNAYVASAPANVYPPANTAGAPPPPPGHDAVGVVSSQGGVGGATWMPRPEGRVGCPPGLEYLSQLDQVLVHQVVELLEAFTGYETENRFVVKNNVGQQFFYAAEESGCCMRFCCSHTRGFVMHIIDNAGNPVMLMRRDFKCCANGCCWCSACDACRYELIVEAPVGNVIGYVREECSFMRTNLTILNEDHQPILRLKGPICECSCPCSCCQDVEFKLITMEGNQIGKVSKQWGGAVKELFTEADNFGINFPMDLDVKVKAVLMGATFLINLMCFDDVDDHDDQ